MILPTFLYRGDSDKTNERSLRATVHHNQFSTNLLQGGQGDLVFKRQLLNLVNDHITAKFEFTHFLSFTEDLESAYRFGMHLHTISKEVIQDCCQEVYEQRNDWNFAIITLDTRILKIISNPSPGIFECIYRPHLLKFKSSGLYRIILIDAKIALSGFKTAAEYATYDKEWLILPATTIRFGNGVEEFSGILDGGCISSVRMFDIDIQKIKGYDTIDY